MSEMDKFLPDFDDILELLEEIKKLRLQKVLVDLNIKKKVSEVYKEVVIDSDYFINGKIPSAVYIKNTWEHTGFDDEILNLRVKLAHMSSELAYLEAKFLTYRDMIDVWRTLSANERINIV